MNLTGQAQITRIREPKMRDERTYKIIGAAMEVYKELGCGFLEAVYHEALGKEFKDREISFKSQPTIQISYKGALLDKTYQPDFICYDEVLTEIKAISDLSGTEETQIINYLKASGLEIGLLINFGSNSLQYKRFVFTHNKTFV